MSVWVHPHKSEGIEPFTLINSPPVKSSLVLTPDQLCIGQVRGPLAIERYRALTMVNSLLCQVGSPRIRRYQALHPGQPSARSNRGRTLHPINTVGSHQVNPQFCLEFSFSVI